MSFKPTINDSALELWTNLLSDINLIQAYGGIMEKESGHMASPASLLPSSKKSIEAAIIRCYTTLLSNRVKRIIGPLLVETFGSATLDDFYSDEHREVLLAAFIMLSKFVDDKDAKLMQRFQENAVDMQRTTETEEKIGIIKDLADIEQGAIKRITESMAKEAEIREQYITEIRNAGEPE